jgi:hypothetical protein
MKKINTIKSEHIFSLSFVDTWNIFETSLLVHLSCTFRDGLAIVAMRQLSRGFCNLPYKMSQKEAFEEFWRIFCMECRRGFLIPVRLSAPSMFLRESYNFSYLPENYFPLVTFPRPKFSRITIHWAIFSRLTFPSILIKTKSTVALGYFFDRQLTTYKGNIIQGNVTQGNVFSRK